MEIKTVKWNSKEKCHFCRNFLRLIARSKREVLIYYFNNRIQMVLLQEKIKVSALIRHYSLHMRAPSTEFISLLKG